MKKYCSLFLVFAILLSLPSISFAETSYSWSEAEAMINEIFGDEKTIWSIDEVDASICLPNLFSPNTLTEEDLENGLVYIYSTESDSAFLLMYYTDSEGLTLDSFYSYYIQNGHDVEMIDVNGIPAALLRDVENDALLLIFLTRDGKIFQTIFSPLSMEAICDLIIPSIRPNVKEEESVEPSVPVNPVSGLISK